MIIEIRAFTKLKLTQYNLIFTYSFSIIWKLLRQNANFLRYIFIKDFVKISNEFFLRLILFSYLVTYKIVV
jgi:hypothetical protein